MGDTDIGFTFDAKPFEKGLDKVMKGMGKMENTASNVAKGVSKGFNSIIAKVGVLAGAFLSIRSALRKMPEIGKAFDIMKDTFLKNLLYPLRKEIMPLLQKMLDWTRDHRSLFVKWGQTLANVFKVVVRGFKTILEFADKVTKQIFNMTSELFGTTIKSFSDLLNILAFKIAVVIEYLRFLAIPIMNAFAPVIDTLKNTLVVVLKDILQIFGTIGSRIGVIARIGGAILEGAVKLLGQVAHFALQIADAFAGGFLDGLTGAEKPLSRIFDAMSGIIDLLFTGEKPLKFWKDVFNALGFIIGTTIKVAFEGLAIVMETIEKVIKAIADFFSSEKFKTFVETVEKLFGDTSKNLKIGAEAQKESGYYGGRSGLTPNNINNGNNRTNSITIPEVNITVESNGENPYELGDVIGKSVVDYVRDLYNVDYATGGN